MFQIPSFEYWLSGTAVFLALSFLVSVVIGIIPIIDGEKRKTFAALLGAGFLISVFGWWSAATQEEKSEHQANQLSAAEDSLRTVRGQLDKMLREMNSITSSLPPPTEIVLLDPAAPAWLKVSYAELNQKEVPGPQENKRIAEYFSSIDPKHFYRDDIDDWASAFVEWSLNKVGIVGAKSSEPFEWLEWGQGLEHPVLGCVVIMSFNGLRHVGFYFGDDDDFIRVLGGNEDDAVRIYRYPKSAIYGYRWPPNLELPKAR